MLHRLLLITVLVAVLVIVAYGEKIKADLDAYDVEQVFTTDAFSLKKEIETEILALAQQDLTLPTNGYRLDILPIGFTLTDHEMNRMLAPAHGKSRPMVYGVNDIGAYTMSSQAINGLHYIVNTYLEGYAPFEVNNVMMPLFILSQRKSYQFDANQYAGREDVWQSSRQAFLYPRGDCEDHAIVLADWLIEKGEDARVVLGDVEDGGGHAWVVLFKHGKEYLLEATQKSGLSRNKPYPAAVLFTDYHPEYMFNRTHFWENTGSKYTTNYSSQHWKKQSRYRVIDQKSRLFKDKPA